ncbi:Fic family protein [Candidatus Gracilibacteria bacterium]|nr:Fic family protein [Candidatus Gracilibacteria bacterium]
MKEILQRIQKKKKKLDQLRPLPASILEKLKHDLSLEWTYNSNAIEGNTLTLQETRLVLEEGITIKGKSLREHFEAKNHEKAIEYLEEFVQTKEVITESQILEIHKLVLDGIEEDFAGRYRNGQVRIMGANFIPPSAQKVPDLIVQFVEDIKNSKQGNILERATFSHHRFVWIHPFFDGNGRTARLLMNILFMQAGYPPAVILRNDRKKYYEALNQANKGDYAKLELLVGQALERSLDMYLSAFQTQTKEETYQLLSYLAPHTPYSAEYLGLLARRGSIDAYKDGRNWLSTLKAVKEYKKAQK